MAAERLRAHRSAFWNSCREVRSCCGKCLRMPEGGAPNHQKDLWFQKDTCRRPLRSTVLAPYEFWAARSLCCGASSLEQEEPAPEFNPPEYLMSGKAVEALFSPCVDNGRKGPLILCLPDTCRYESGKGICVSLEPRDRKISSPGRGFCFSFQDRLVSMREGSL